MTRLEFLSAYCRLAKHERGRRPSEVEAKAHASDRIEAGRIWRIAKKRLQNETVEDWQSRTAKFDDWRKVR